MSRFSLSLRLPDRPSKRLCELRLASAQSAEAAAELLATAIARRSSHDDTAGAWLEVESENRGLVCIVVISAYRPDVRSEVYEDLDRTLRARCSPATLH